MNLYIIVPDCSQRILLLLVPIEPRFLFDLLDAPEFPIVDGLSEMGTEEQGHPEPHCKEALEKSGRFDTKMKLS